MDKIKMINLDWEIDRAKISKILGNVPVAFHNDLLAMASFIPKLAEVDLPLKMPSKVGI